MSSSSAARPRRARRLASGGAIREAAAELFLRKGYQATSMDDIAAAAQVSKQTIYTHFAGKEELFADLVLGNADRVEMFITSSIQPILLSDDVEAGLRKLARDYVGLVGTVDVLRLRRLVLGEVGRFPDLARTYYERVPGRVLIALTDLFRDLSARKALTIENPAVAAEHFAWLTLGIALDRGMFYSGEGIASEVDLDAHADAAVRVFLAAYGKDARIKEGG